MGRARFSLLTILLLVVIIACGIHIFQLSGENKHLRDDVARLESMAGDFEVSDNTKVYLRPLECSGALTWRFYAFIPHRECKVRAVPILDGIAKRKQSDSCKISIDGKYILTLNLGQSGRDEIDYRVYVNSFHSGVTSGGYLKADLDVSKLWWSHDPHSEFVGPLITKGERHGKLAVHATDKPILLARLMEDNDDPKSNGIEFWLDATKADDFLLDDRNP